MASRSEFADAYKLKPDVLEKRNARLQRRSIEWKNMRYEEVGKRRKIDLDNLSPLQEQDQNISNVSKKYEDKTPVKPTSEKKTKSDLLKQRLVQWKQEKERKKKMVAEERARKLPFKVTGVKHKDTDIFTKDKKGATKSTVIKPKVTSTTSTTHNKASTSLRQSKPVVGTVTQHAQKSAPDGKTVKAKPQPPPPVPTARATRQTRSSARLKGSPKATAVPKSTLARNQKTIKSTSKTEAPKTRSTRAKKLSPEYNIDLAKVSTDRGESFAPSDFTFEAPDSVKSFAFQPLSPASTASFLNPNHDLTSTSFFSHEPPAGRCSTPKSAKEEDIAAQDTLTDDDATVPDSGKVTASTVVKHSPVMQTENRSALSSVTSSESDGDVSNNKTAIRLVSTVEKKKKKKSADIAAKGDSESSTDSEAPKAPITPRRSGRKSVRQDTTTSDGHLTVTTDETSSCKLRNKSQTESSSTDGETSSDGKTLSKATRTRAGKKKTETEADAEKTPGKRRLSVRKPKEASDAETDMTVVQNTADEPKGKTPVKMSRRKSVRKQKDDSSAEEDKTDVKDSVEEAEPAGKTPVKTRRSSVRNEDSITYGQADADMSAVEAVVDSDKETEIKTPRSARRKRKSSNKSVSDVCVDQVFSMEVIQEEKNSTESLEDDVFHSDPETVSMNTAETGDTKDTGTKSVDVPSNSDEMPVDSVPEKDKCTPVRNRRVSSSDACFRTPGLPLSAQRSGRKRRRTESSSNSTQAKSPEEWVKILSTSPMVEMRRRTPKAPRLAEDSLSQPLNFDDVLEEPMDVFVSVEHSTGSGSEKTGCPGTSAVLAAADTQGASSSSGTAASDPLDNTTTSASAGDKKEEEHNVPYFRNLLVSETARLNSSSDEWTKISKETPGIAEEVEGQIRTTVGQAQLLIAQRFKQFSGLVDNCEFGTGEKETTCTDLQGFWDMIFYQVEDVDKKFVQLTTLRNNNWQEAKPTAQVVKKVIKKKFTAAPKPKAGGGPSKFAAFRAQMKKQKEEAAAAAKGSSPVEAVKVFDAGFFKVSSPVKSPAPHCEGGSPAKFKANSEPTTGKSETASDVPPKDVDVAQALLKKTPRRKSYVPSVPSPLLCDITPKLKIRRSLCVPQVEDRDTAVTTSPLGVFTPPAAGSSQPYTSLFTPPSSTSNHTTPKRRSIRLRKSLTLTSTEEERSSQHTASNEHEAGGLDPRYLEPSGSSTTTEEHNSSDCDLTKFMQPTTPSQNSDEHDSSFSKFFQPTAAPAQSGRRSALKKLPSAQRRRSRRSVQFAMSLESSPVAHQRLPSTPFNNKDTVVPKPRVSHGDYLFTPPKEDSESGDTAAPGNSPVLRGRPRPSLLFTPATQNSVSRTEGDNLMVFTP